MPGCFMANIDHQRFHFRSKRRLQMAEGRENARSERHDRYVPLSDDIVFNDQIPYSSLSILRPPMGPRQCGLILQVVLK